MIQRTAVDDLINAADRALRALTDSVAVVRPSPAAQASAAASSSADALTDAQRDEAGALMRVNHVGEVCAQALYEGQALGTAEPDLKRLFRAAAQEEADHLHWTRERIDQLGGRVSLLNPLWYAGAFGFGWLASRMGRDASLGFMAETEVQVERHLDGHLSRLPVDDRRSRAIVSQMKEDEGRHAQAAAAQGAVKPPLPVRLAMRMAAKVMTTVAHRL